MHQDALHELMENFRRQLLNIQVTIHDLQELIHSLNVFLLILQFRFHLWDVRFTLLLLCMAQLVKMFYDKEKMDKNIEKTTIKIQ